MIKDITCPNCGLLQQYYKSMQQDKFITCIRCNYKWILLNQNNIHNGDIKFLLNDSITNISKTLSVKNKPEVVSKAPINSDSTNKNNNSNNFNNNFRPNKQNSTHSLINNDRVNASVLPNVSANNVNNTRAVDTNYTKAVTSNTQNTNANNTLDRVKNINARPIGNNSNTAHTRNNNYTDNINESVRPIGNNSNTAHTRNNNYTDNINESVSFVSEINNKPTNLANINKHYAEQVNNLANNFVKKDTKAVNNAVNYKDSHINNTEKDSNELLPNNTVNTSIDKYAISSVSNEFNTNNAETDNSFKQKFSTDSIQKESAVLNKLKEFSTSNLDVDNPINVEELLQKKHSVSKIKQMQGNKGLHTKKDNKANEIFQANTISNLQQQHSNTLEQLQQVDASIYNNIDVKSLKVLDDTNNNPEDTSYNSTVDNNLQYNFNTEKPFLQFKPKLLGNSKVVVTILFSILILIIIVYAISKSSIIDEKKPVVNAKSVNVSPIIKDDLVADNVDISNPSITSHNNSGNANDDNAFANEKKPQNNDVLILDDNTLLNNDLNNSINSQQYNNFNSKSIDSNYNYFNGLKLSFKRRINNLFNDVLVSSTYSKWRSSLLERHLETIVTLTNTSKYNYTITELYIVFIDVKQNVLLEKSLGIKQVINVGEQINLILKLPEAPANTTNVFIYIGKYNKLN